MSNPDLATDADRGPVLGHVHLRVADLARSVAFYTDIVGLTLRGYYGDRMAFLANRGYHHHLALNTLYSLSATPAPGGHAGLHHSAFVYPDRAALAEAVRRVVAADVEITGAYDHGVSEAVYFNDPDGNGVELCWDRPEGQWPRDGEGKLQVMNEPFELATLLREPDPASAGDCLGQA